MNFWFLICLHTVNHCLKLDHCHPSIILPYNLSKFINRIIFCKFKSKHLHSFEHDNFLWLFYLFSCTRRSFYWKTRPYPMKLPIKPFSATCQHLHKSEDPREESETLQDVTRVSMKARHNKILREF